MHRSHFKTWIIFPVVRRTAWSDVFCAVQHCFIDWGKRRSEKSVSHCNVLCDHVHRLRSGTWWRALKIPLHHFRLFNQFKSAHHTALSSNSSMFFICFARKNFRIHLALHMPLFYSCRNLLTIQNANEDLLDWDKLIEFDSVQHIVSVINMLNLVVIIRELP